MRTPNSKCIICGKPLYRRPYELKKIRYVSCMKHRVGAQNMFGRTEAQIDAFKLGRPKGTNHLKGLPKSIESNIKRSVSISKWCRANKEKVLKRASKTRGKNHYNWRGGSSNLNITIRQMTENRKWMDRIKARDKKCVRCNSVENLESHHIKPLSTLIAELNISNYKDARKHAEILWDMNNGITLCRCCHYKEHGRFYED